MEGIVWLGVIGIVVWLWSNSGNSNNRGSNSSSGTIYSGQSKGPIVQTSAPSVRDYPRTSKIIKEGFQPDDRCSCGGTWVKRENRETGGRFFSCSNYPTCKNSREKVLKARLGAGYSEIYCSRGHHKPTFGTVWDAASGKLVCKKCVDKGYLNLWYRSTPSRNRDEIRKKNQSEPPPNISALKTNGNRETCKNGHVRTKENTYIRPDGSRECRVCKKNSRQARF